VEADFLVAHVGSCRQGCIGAMTSPLPLAEVVAPARPTPQFRARAGAHVAAAAAALAVLVAAYGGDAPHAFARQHAFPVGKWQLLEAYEKGPGSMGFQDQQQLLTSLKDAYAEEIKKWGQRRKWQVALANYVEMNEKGLGPTEASCNAVVSAVTERDEKWQIGLQLLDELRLHGFDARQETFLNLADSARRCGGWSAGLQVLEDMRQANIEMDDFSYFVTLKCAEHFKGWELALATLQEMQEREEEIVVEGPQFSLVFDICYDAYRDEEAEWVEDEAAKRGHWLQGKYDEY